MRYVPFFLKILGKLRPKADLRELKLNLNTLNLLLGSLRNSNKERNRLFFIIRAEEGEFWQVNHGSFKAVFLRAPD